MMMMLPGSRACVFRVLGTLPATGDWQGSEKNYVNDAKAGREVAALPKMAGTGVLAVSIIVRALRTVPWGRGCDGWKRFGIDRSLIRPSSPIPRSFGGNESSK
jgi:hypothetical protein